MDAKRLATGIKDFFIDLVKFTWKWSLILVFVTYVFVGLFFTWKWLETGFYRMIPIEILHAKIDEARGNDDIEKAVFLVRIRPPQESRAVIAAIEPHAPRLEPLFYLELAKRYRWLGDEDRAAFWTYLAKYRLNYDMYRCKDVQLDVGTFMLYWGFPYELKDLVEKLEGTDEMFGHLEDVLEWDEKNPPQTRPEYLCAYLARMHPGMRDASDEAEPEEKWPFHRDMMRFIAERAIWCNTGNEKYRPDKSFSEEAMDRFCLEDEGWKEKFRQQLEDDGMVDAPTPDETDAADDYGDEGQTEDAAEDAVE